MNDAQPVGQSLPAGLDSLASSETEPSSGCALTLAAPSCFGFLLFIAVVILTVALHDLFL